MRACRQVGLRAHARSRLLASAQSDCCATKRLYAPCRQPPSHEPPRDRISALPRSCIETKMHRRCVTSYSAAAAGLMGRDRATENPATKLELDLNMFLRALLASWIAVGVLSCPVSCLCEASEQACTQQRAGVHAAEPAGTPTGGHQHRCSCEGLTTNLVRQDQKGPSSRLTISARPARFLAFAADRTHAVASMLRHLRQTGPDRLRAGVTLRFAISSLLL